MKISGIIRTGALGIMIAGAAIADAILWWECQWVWASFWLVIILLVSGYEIVCYAVKRKTISTMWKDWAIKNPVTSKVVLVILFISLTALCVHLGVW